MWRRISFFKLKVIIWYCCWCMRCGRFKVLVNFGVTRIFYRRVRWSARKTFVNNFLLLWIDISLVLWVLDVIIIKFVKLFVWVFFFMVLRKICRRVIKLSSSRFRRIFIFRARFFNVSSIGLFIMSLCLWLRSICVKFVLLILNGLLSLFCVFLSLVIFVIWVSVKRARKLSFCTIVITIRTRGDWVSVVVDLCLCDV